MAEVELSDHADGGLASGDHRMADLPAMMTKQRSGRPGWIYNPEDGVWTYTPLAHGLVKATVVLKDYGYVGYGRGFNGESFGGSDPFKTLKEAQETLEKVLWGTQRSYTDTDE